MRVKAKGIDLEMLTVKSVLRSLGRLPPERAVAVLDYVATHLKANVPIGDACPPQLHLATAMTGAARKG